MSDVPEMTDEEKERQVAAYIQRFADFAGGTKRECPHCGTMVTGARLYEKIEPDMFSLYVLPCNCRMGLWGRAPVWITDVEVVPLEW